MSDSYGELTLGTSNSQVGNRFVIANYLTRPAKAENDPAKLELGIIQTELNARPPTLEFEFDPAGKFKLHGVQPPQPPVVAVKSGDVRIEIPAECQLHEIRDGKHFALKADLTQEIFQQFVDNSDEFPPRLSQLSEFLEELQSRVPEIETLIG